MRWQASSELNLKWPWIDFRQQLTARDGLTFLKEYVYKLPIDAALYRDCVIGHDRTKPVQVDFHSTALCHGRHYRNGLRARSALPCSNGGLGIAGENAPERDSADQHEDGRNTYYPWPASL